MSSSRKIPFALTAPRAAALVVQIGRELDGQRARRFDHRVEARDRVAVAGQHDEEAQACDRAVRRGCSRSNEPGSVRLATLNAFAVGSDWR